MYSIQRGLCKTKFKQFPRAPHSFSPVFLCCKGFLRPFITFALLIVVLKAVFLLSPVIVFTAPPAFTRELKKPVVNKY